MPISARILYGLMIAFATITLAGFFYVIRLAILNQNPATLFIVGSLFLVTKIAALSALRWMKEPRGNEEPASPRQG